MYYEGIYFAGGRHSIPARLVSHLELFIFINMKFVARKHRLDNLVYLTLTEERSV